MFKTLNLAAGVLHLVLFLIIVIVSLYLKAKERSIYKLRFVLQKATVPEPPEECTKEGGEFEGEKFRLAIRGRARLHTPFGDQSGVFRT